MCRLQREGNGVPRRHVIQGSPAALQPKLALALKAFPLFLLTLNNDSTLKEEHHLHRMLGGANCLP